MSSPDLANVTHVLENLLSTGATLTDAATITIYPVRGAHYKIPALGQDSVVKFSNTGAVAGDWFVVTADGGQGAQTVTYDRDDDTDLTIAMPNSIPHACFAVFDGTHWACIATCSTTPVV